MPNPSLLLLVDDNVITFSHIFKHLLFHIIIVPLLFAEFENVVDPHLAHFPIIAHSADDRPALLGHPWLRAKTRRRDQTQARRHGC